MSRTILPIAGAVGGLMLGGIGGALIGGTLGSAAGNLLQRGKTHRINSPTQHGARLRDLRVQLSSYGQVIPKVYGTMRLAGNIIWAMDIKEVATEHSESYSQSTGGKGGGGRQTTITSQSSVSYSYYATLAIAICEGAIDEIIRIWADSMLLNDEILSAGQGKYNIHLGSEDQLPDSIIGKYKQGGTYPAYRGIAYVAIEDFPLEQFGNRIPNFSFEVRRTLRFYPAVEDKIKEVILIPGAGEFVYGTGVYNKQISTGIDGGIEEVVLPTKAPLNMHNYKNRPNVLIAIEQMRRTLPNLEWVGLVVTWFASSSKAGNCKIVPKVEFRAIGSRVIPNDWNVAGITRGLAELVLFFDADKPVPTTPTYGGTPSDETVLAIISYLKELGLKIMFYPMIFVDEITPNPKPWRGRITANNRREITNWFNNPSTGYNRFIMHYAALMQGKVDAFIIGSELIGLTSFTDRACSYPAVDELVKLAAKVKGRLGASTLVTYAADWSEYHHTSGGWYNLDPLWASPDIDFIGIDNYMPLTEDLPQSQITERLIKAGWQSGEGFDYYYDTNRKNKFPLSSPYAWKNIEYWWSNVHKNPDGNITPWRPKAKPIWFTEFGFPSVDGATNQPNVFYDPTSVESHFPRGSKGKINFFAQRQALNSSLDYFCEVNNREPALIQKSFVWTYDARSFPFWPDFKNVWQDGNLWATGHWINGKLGMSTLGAIVANILGQVGLSDSDYDVSRLTDEVQGYIISESLTARDAITTLQSAYFFDAVESEGVLKFVKKDQGFSVATILERELVPSNQANTGSSGGGSNGSGGNNSNIVDTLELTIAQELELPQKVSITHIDMHQNYDLVTMEAQRQIVSTKEQINISLPLVLNNQIAKQIAEVILYNAWQERITYSLTLPPKYAYLEPTDVINVITSNGSGNSNNTTNSNNKISHQMRIIKTNMERTGLMKIIAHSFNMEIYEQSINANTASNANNVNNNASYLLPNYELPRIIPNTILELVETPTLPNDNNATQAILRIATIPDGNNWQGAAIYCSNNDGFDYKLIATTTAPAIIGITLNTLNPAPTTTFDHHNEIIVQLLNPQSILSSCSELALLNGANAAMIGEELIQFQNAQVVADGKYKLTKLLRGRCGTQWAINNHKAGDRFTYLNTGITSINMNHNLIGKELLFKAVSIGKSLAEVEPIRYKFTAKNLKPLSPVHLKVITTSNKDINICWIRRSRIDADWRDNIDVPLGEENESYEVEITSNGKLINRGIKSGGSNAVFSRAMQIASGLMPKQPLTITVYQLSTAVGRGYCASVRIN